jgi:hypothetical protein
MVELRVAGQTPDPEEFQARRDEILARHGVTDSALVAFARRVGRDPERMALIWDTIAARLAAQQRDIE